MAESYSFGYWGSTSEEILKSQFPLHRACRDGDVEELSRLLVVAQNGIYEEDSFYGWTPAHWAAYFGKLACLRKLMTVTRIGVNCNIRTSRFKHTPAHLAAFQGHPQCLLWLLQYGAEMDAQDYLGETCVHKAARTGSMECVSLLTSHGARLYIHNNNGKLASEVAAMCGFEECARYLNVATKRQEDQARGVYQAGPDAHAAKTPSPLDITINGKVEPCVIMQGLNGGRLPPPGPGGENMDCEMETESQGTFINGSSLPENVSLPCKTDVTLSSKNVVVAGRKRGREDAEDMDYKRMRRSDTGCTEPAFPGQTSLVDPYHMGIEVDSATGTPFEASNLNNNEHPEPYQQILALSTEPMAKPVGNEPRERTEGQNNRRWLIFV